MATIKHTLMREDLSTVNARQFSPDRTDVTMQMALDSIGGLERTLVLTDEEDGIWQLTADVTIPVNVCLQIPLGVTLVGPGDLTILGGLIALRWPVHLGPGVVIHSGAALGHATSNLYVDHLNVRDLWVSERIAGVGHFYFGQGRIGPPAPEEPYWRPGFWHHALTSLVDVNETGRDYAGFAINTHVEVATDSDAWIGASGSGLRIDAHGHVLTGVQVGFSAGAYIVGVGTLQNVVGFRAIHAHYGLALVKNMTSFLAETADNPGGGVIENYHGLLVWDPGPEIGTIKAYGVYSNMTAGATPLQRYNIYAIGTARNMMWGNLGIGTEPHATYGLLVGSSAAKPGGGSWTDSSDESMKDHITPITGALTRLLQLRGVTYTWRDPERRALLPGEQLGFIAQEVETVMPSWVGVEEETGMKNLTLRGEFALTVEALRELTARVQALEEAATT